jgi:hypothetical protein
MKAELQRVKIESVIPDDDDLSIEDATGRQGRA